MTAAPRYSLQSMAVRSYAEMPGRLCSPPCSPPPQGNQLTGGLPGEWGSESMEGLPALSVLNLSRNPLGGSLPPEWGRKDTLPSLRTL